VIAALGQLSPNQRLAVVLHDYADRPVAEVAATIGASRATVHVHLSKAGGGSASCWRKTTMRDLKDLLEPLGDRPMPDRWDSIQRRPVKPLPEPHRSRVGAGFAAAAIALLAIAVIVWLLPLGRTGTEPESSTPPQPSKYVSPQGWTVTLPPGWTTQEFSVHEQAGSMQGTVIADQSVGAPGLNEFAIPVFPSDRFPSDAVALVVGDVPGANTGGVQPAIPPLSYSDFRQAGSSGNSTIRGLTFEGPRQLFFATTQVGVDASAADMDALRATIAGLTFTDEGAALPSPSGAPGYRPKTRWLTADS
jgi:hypothetical protein